MLNAEAQALFRHATALHQQGSLDQARQSYDEVLRRSPLHVGALHLRGALALQAGALPEAVHFIGAALALHPGYAEAHNNLGIALNGLKRAEEALLSFGRALEYRPDYAEAHNNLGIALAGLGRAEEALASFERAVACKPDYPDARTNICNALRGLGRLEEAVASYDQALALRPGHAETHNLRGTVLRDLHRPEAALASYDQAIALAPHLPEPHFNRAITLRGLGRAEEALASYERAIALRPDHAEAHNNRGNLLIDLGRHDEAVQSFDQALAARPGYVEALHNRGVALREAQQPEAALASFDSALALSPSLAETHYIRAAVLRGLGRLEAALAGYDSVVALQPGRADAYNNRGNLLLDLNRPEEALASFNQAIQVQPDHVEAHNNRGVALKELQRLGEALAEYEHAISLKPDYASTLLNRALATLLGGDLASGFRHYEVRRHPPGTTPAPLPPPGASLAGKRVLVTAEQGLGDTFQFCRYVKLLKQQQAEVCFAVQPALLPLFRQWEPEVCRLLPPEAAEPECDYRIPLLSLPLVFGTTLASVPAATPYLRAEPERVARWRGRLGGHGFKVGICWQGSTAPVDRGRSFPVAEFERLSQIPGVRLISLHRGAGEAQLAQLPPGMQVEALGEAFDAPGAAFLDTAAVIRLCDLVITSDSAVAHLAGALGVRAWVVLRHVPDWRWLLHREDSPWYPTARLFRQERPGDWASAFAKVETALRAEWPRPGAASAAPLVPLSWGEVLDRMASLKVKQARLAGGPALVQASRELAQLEAIVARSTCMSAAVQQAMDDLWRINRQLADMEERLRALEQAKQFNEAFIQLARSVYQTNDMRAQLQQRINELTMPCPAQPHHQPSLQGH